MSPSLAQRTLDAITSSEQAIRIGILVFDGVTMLDVVGPADAFMSAMRPASTTSAARAAYRVVTIGVTDRPCTSEGGLSVLPAFTLRTAPALDTVIVPGGRGLREHTTNRTISEWVRRRSPRIRRIASVCTGIHIAHGDLDVDRLWREGVGSLSRATGTDGTVGRKTWIMMKRLGVVDLGVDYVTVDTLRVSRATFAEIIRSWRDGFAQVIEQHGRFDRGEVRALFDAAIATVLDPQEYSVWHVPIVSGRTAPKDGR